GQEMVILPSSPGTGPRYVFRHVRDTMPIVALGVGHAGSQQHAPNENIKLQDYAEAVHHVAEILAGAGRSGLHPPTYGRQQRKVRAVAATGSRSAPRPLRRPPGAAQRRVIVLAGVGAGGPANMQPHEALRLPGVARANGGED